MGQQEGGAAESETAGRGGQQKAGQQEGGGAESGIAGSRERQEPMRGIPARVTEHQVDNLPWFMKVLMVEAVRVLPSTHDCLRTQVQLTA